MLETVNRRKLHHILNVQIILANNFNLKMYLDEIKVFSMLDLKNIQSS